MNGAWLINSAMILMAAVAFVHVRQPCSQTIQDAYHTLGPLFGRSAAVMFAVALLVLGAVELDGGGDGGAGDYRGLPGHQIPHLSSAADHDRAGDPVIAIGLDPLKILVLSQVVLSFALPFALIPLLILTSRTSVMESFASARRTRVAGWAVVAVILTLNAVLLGQIAVGVFIAPA